MIIRNVLIISVLVLALLAVPVLAATTKTDEKPAESIPQAQAPNQATLSRLTVTGYNYFINHGGSCRVNAYIGTNVQPSDVLYNFAGLEVDLGKKPTNSLEWLYAMCPLNTIGSITGKHPVVRYGFIRFASENSMSGINQIRFFNGESFVTELGSDKINAFSTGGESHDLNFDLGQWYEFHRGMNIAVHMINQDPNNRRWVAINGYGARGDILELIPM